MGSGHRSLTAQLVGVGLQFSYGDVPVRFPISSSGRLEGVLRLSGRLPSGTGSSVLSSVSEVLRGDQVFQLRALCFGPSTALQVFTRVMGPVSLIMHCYGFRILRYLDDWLVLGSSFWEIVRARDFLLWLCRELGILVNQQKSTLTPQTLDYLGMRLQTSSLRVFPTLKLVQKVSSLVTDFMSCRRHPFATWKCLLGVMS